MNCYLVVSPNVEDSEIAAAFPNGWMPVMGGAWVVASNDPICADVAERLGMNAERSKSGVVVRVGEYFGYYNRALWDRIEAWKAAT